SLIRLLFLDHSIKLSTFVTKLNALHLMRPPVQKPSERDHLNLARIQLVVPIALGKQKLHSDHLLDEHLELRYEGLKQNMAHSSYRLGSFPQYRLIQPLPPLVIYFLPRSLPPQHYFPSHLTELNHYLKIS